jgi:hypothetical protein
MFDTPALMRALEEFKVSANKPLPPMSDRLLEEAWHGSILHDTVRNAEADSSDDEGGRSSDEEISVDSGDGAESSDDDNSDDEADAPVPDEEESEDEDEVRVFSSSSDILP